MEKNLRPVSPAGQSSKKAYGPGRDTAEVAAEVGGTVVWLAFSLPVAMIIGILNGALQGRERFAALNGVGVLSNSLSAIVPLTIAWLVGPTLWMLVAGALGVLPWTLPTLIGVPGIVLGTRHYRRKFRRGPARAAGRDRGVGLGGHHGIGHHGHRAPKHSANKHLVGRIMTDGGGDSSPPFTFAPADDPVRGKRAGNSSRPVDAARHNKPQRVTRISLARVMALPTANIRRVRHQDAAQPTPHSPMTRS